MNNQLSVLMAAGLLVALSVFSMGCEQVPTGHVGVVDSFGKVTGDVVPEGLNFMAPWKDVTDLSIQQMNMNFNKSKGAYGSINAAARDKTTVAVDSTVIFYLNAQDDKSRKNASVVLQKLGEGWPAKLIVANMRTSVRQAVSEFDAMEAATTSRAEVGSKTQAILTQKVADLLTERGIDPTAVVIQAVEMRAIKLPTAIQKNILAVQNQKSAALERENAKATEKLEQERKLIAQQGETAVRLEEARRKSEVREIDSASIAKYNRTVNSSLTDKLLRQQEISATRAILQSKNTTTVFLNPSQPMLFNK